MIKKLILLSILLLPLYNIEAQNNWGDVNRDGLADIVDSLLIAQFYVGMQPVIFDPEAADADYDGEITIVDALLIAQFYIGLYTPNTPTPSPDIPVGTIIPKPIDQLPNLYEMPDPLTMINGTKVTTQAQWNARRQEMIQIMEEYEYGHMPPPPGNVTAKTVVAEKNININSTTSAMYRRLHLAFGPMNSLGFDLGIFTPNTPNSSEVPVLISLTMSSGEYSLADASAALRRGYAVATINYQELGADSSRWKQSAFFPAYPDYDWRDISAWAWGISRAVDYVVTDSTFDSEKIMITGVSRLGQAVLLAGALDERIALSAPVAGGMALRYSGREMGGGLGQGITEIVDQVTYWFGPRFPEFRNKTPKLPCDQHWLPALTAPRLFIMCNALEDPYGRAYAAAQTFVYAQPVYEFLNVDKNIGVHFRPGGHGITSEDWSAILDFADQYLMKKGGSREFDVLPPPHLLP